MRRNNQGQLGHVRGNLICKLTACVRLCCVSFSYFDLCVCGGRWGVGGRGAEGSEDGRGRWRKDRDWRGSKRKEWKELNVNEKKHNHNKPTQLSFFLSSYVYQSIHFCFYLIDYIYSNFYITLRTTITITTL